MVWGEVGRSDKWTKGETVRGAGEEEKENCSAPSAHCTNTTQRHAVTQET